MFFLKKTFSSLNRVQPQDQCTAITTCVVSGKNKQLTVSEAFLAPGEFYCCLVTIIRNTDNMHVLH